MVIPSTRHLVVGALVAVAAAAVGLGAGVVFGSTVLTVPVVAAALVAVAVHLALRQVEAPLVVRVLVSLVVVAVVAAALVVGSLGPSAFATVVDGWVNGVARLLSSAVPAPQTPDLVVVPVTVTWLVAAVGAEVAVGRRPVAVVVPLVLGVVAVQALGGTIGAVTVILVVATVLVGLVLRSPATAVEARGFTRAVVGRLAAGLVLTLVLAVVAAGIAPSAPVVSSRPAFDPRDARELEPERTRQLSPLTATIGALTLSEPVELFRIDTTAPSRVRTVALDTYDGASWRATKTYVPSSRDLPAPGDGGLTPPSTPAEVTIAPLGLRGPFLPVLGQPTRIELDAFRVAPASGDLVVADGDVSELEAYAFEAVLPTPTNELEGAFRARASELEGLDRWTDLPPLPADVRQLAESIVADAETDYEQLVALRDHFVSDDYVLVDPTDFDATSGQQLPAGHAIGQLRDFLGLRESGGRPRVGTIEQFTATFTVMARLLGFPARLAVGYREAADGEVVTTARSHAWPEVAMAGQGWTLWDPTPLVDEPGIEPPEPPAPAAAEQPLPQSTPEFDEEVVLPELEEERPSPFLVAVVIAGLVALVALLVLLGRWTARWRRRRRRWAIAPADERVLLVWNDIVSRLGRVGIDVDETSTGTDVIRAVRATPWAHDIVPDVGAIGGLAARAAYGRAGVDPRVVAEVDAAHDRVRRAVREQQSVVERVRTSVGS